MLVRRSHNLDWGADKVAAVGMAVETVAGLVVALSRVILTDKNVVTVVRFLSHFAKNESFTKTGSRQT